jgi:hypothetical protein
MPRKPESKPKLTDAERHKRFVNMAREVEASDDPKDFEEAFQKVVRPISDKAPKKNSD